MVLSYRFLMGVTLAWALLASPSRGEVTCTIQQLTDEPEGFFGPPDLSLGSPWVVFDGAIPGSLGAGFEVYRLNLVTEDFENLTNMPGLDANPTVNADGSRIAFVSETNRTGSNSDGNREVFLLDVATEQFTQLTDSTDFGNFSPLIDVTGTRIVFGSSNDLVGENPFNFRQTFLYDTESDSLTQVTQLDNSFGTSFGVDPEASLLAFSTGTDVKGNTEIFLLDLETPGSEPAQITRTVEGQNGAPDVSLNGKRISFLSNSEEYVGENSDGLSEIVSYDSCNGRFRQWSDANPNIVGGQIVSPDGNRIVTALNGDLWVYDVATGVQKMVVSTSEIINLGTSNFDGSVFGFSSNADLTGENSDQSFEVFLATCEGLALFADDFECGDTSAWSIVESGSGVGSTVTEGDSSSGGS